jgi:OCT family organic cation transporter-like MFS transporter 18
LQAPLEPYLVDRLLKSDGGSDGSKEAAAASYAQLQSFFSLVQILGSLVVGFLLDKLGIRFAFALNFFACAASFGLLAAAGSVRDLYLSKLPTVFMTGFLCAQTAVAKLTQPGPDRVNQLGRLTMACVFACL